MNAIEQFFPPAALPAARAELAARIAAIEAAHGANGFLMSREDASLHEAGHAVIGALWGRKIRLCRVMPKTIGDRVQWGGKTLARPDAYVLDEKSEPASDFAWSCFTAGGSLAEHLFSKLPRAGSGLDEMIVVKHAASSIAFKTGGNPRVVAKAILGTTVQILKRHEAAVRELAAQLMDRNLIAQKEIEVIFYRHGLGPDQGFIEHGVFQ
jgi:hypothetical protein